MSSTTNSNNNPSSSTSSSSVVSVTSRVPPATVTHTPKGPPVRFASALEGFLAMMVCLFMISYTKSLLIDIVTSSAKDDIIGAAQVGSILLVTILLYSRRWRNYTLSPFQAWISVGKGFLQSFLRLPSLSLVWEWLFIVLLYGIQIIILGYRIQTSTSAVSSNGIHSISSSSSSFSSSSFDLYRWIDQLLTCSTSMSLVWAPIIEELIFRVILFYVVLHRSGGNVGLACTINACTFGAIHFSNIYYNMDNIYSWLQMFGGILCGTAWTLLYAITGSISLVIFLHVTNNLAAIAWLSYTVTIDTNKSCTDTEFTLELLLSMTIQIGVYIMVILACWRRLYSLINPHDVSFTKNNPKNTIIRVPLWYKFKTVHPILYNGNNSEENEEEIASSTKNE